MEMLRPPQRARNHYHQMLPRAFSVVTFGLLSIIPSFAGDPPSPESRDIAGVYEGHFSYRNHSFSLELTINRKVPTNSLAGVFSFSGETTSGRVESYAMKGDYDPANQQFKLQPTHWITKTPGAQVGLEGQFNPTTGNIEAQIIGDKEPFALTLNPQKTAKLQAAAAAEAKKLEQGPTALADAKSDDERRGVLVRWFRQLRKEFPDIDLRHTAVDQLSSKVIVLFYDDKFVPVFGKAYDSLNIDERNNLKHLGQQLFGSPETRELLEGFGDFVLSRPFEFGTSAYLFGDFAPKVARRRSILQAWQDKIDKLNTLPASSAGYDELVAIRREGDKPFEELSPAKLTQFHEAIDSALSRIAEGSLLEKAQAAVTAANTSVDVSAMRKLFIEEGELLGLVTENVKTKTLEQIDNALRSVLEADERQNTITGSGIVAVLAGNKWWRRVNDVYGFANARPPVQDAMNRIIARRAADLALAAPSIAAEISQQPNEAAAVKVKDSYLIAPRDADVDAGVRINKAVSARQAELKRESQRGWLSPHERAWMSCNGKITPPTPLPPPDEDDIRFAITRELTSMGGKRVGTYAVHWGNEGRSISVSVQRVDPDSVTKNEDGFKVHYYLEVDCNVNQSLTTIFSTGAGADEIVDSITGELDGEHDDSFVFGEQGWSSPTLHKRQISYLN